MKIYLLVLLVGLMSLVQSRAVAGNEITFLPKKPGVIRILLFGPGLNHPDLEVSSLPSTLLQANLNRDCKGCYEVVNASVPGNFSTSSLLLLEKMDSSASADLIAYYESGYFLSADILERFHYRIDGEEELPVIKDASELYQNPCCASVLNLFGESFRRRLTLVLNYVGIFKDSKKVMRRDLKTVSADVVGNFNRMTVSSKRNVDRKVVLLLHPKGFKVDRLVFEQDLLQEFLFKFLIFFYTPDKFPIGKLFMHQAFTTMMLGPDLNDLYTPENLMRRHPYNLNTVGSALWARSAGSALRRYFKLQKNPYSDGN